MNITELLLFIFTDELMGSLLVPVSDKYVLNATLILQEIDIKFFFVAFFGTICGVILNYYLGVVTVRLLNINVGVTRKEVKYTLYLSLLLVPFGFFGTVSTYLCGMSRIGLRNVILIGGCSSLLYLIFRFFLL